MPRSNDDLEAELDKIFGAEGGDGDLEAELDALFKDEPAPVDAPAPQPASPPSTKDDKRARQDAFAKKLAEQGIAHRQLLSGSVQVTEKPKGAVLGDIIPGPVSGITGSDVAVSAGKTLDDIMAALTAITKTQRVGGKSVWPPVSPYGGPLEDTAVSRRVESTLRVPAGIPMGAGSAALGVLSGHPLEGLYRGASRAATDLVSGAVGAVSPSASDRLEQALGLAGQPGGGELFAARYGMDPEAAHGLEAIAGLGAAAVGGGLARGRKAKARARLLEEFPPDEPPPGPSVAPASPPAPPLPTAKAVPPGPAWTPGALPERVGGRLLKKFDMTGDAQQAFAAAAHDAAEWGGARRYPISAGGPGVSWQQTAADAMNLLERYGADPKSIFEKDLEFPELAARARALAEVAVAAGEEVAAANAAFKASPLDAAAQARLATAVVRLDVALEPTVVASTELGRGLNHLKAMTGDLAKSKKYAEIVKMAGGAAKLETLSKMLDTMPDAAARAKLVKRFAPLKSAEQWWTAWTSNMLTGIGTHVVNPLGSVTGGMYALLETVPAATIGLAGEGIAKLRGKESPGRVRFREIAPQIKRNPLVVGGAGIADMAARKFGIQLGEALPSLVVPIEAFRRANRAVAESWKTGVDIFQDVRSEHKTAMVLERRRKPLEEFGRSVGLEGDALEQFIRASMPSKAARLASGDFIGLRAVAMEDSWFKSIYRDAGYERLLIREGANNGLRGRALDEYVATEMAKDPTTVMLKTGESLEAAAKDYARYLTFSDVSQYAKFYRSIERQADARGFKLAAATMRVVAPFTNTPLRLANHVVNRAWQGPVPLAVISPEFWRGVKAGGAPRQQALGRIAIGGLAAAYFANLALQGKITGSGPRDPGQRFLLTSLGWQPYSRRFGNTWVSYSRLDPLAGQIGLAADYAEMMAESPELKNVDDIAGRIAFSIARNLTSKVYLQGLSRAVELFDMEDPSFLRRFERFVGGNLGTVVPAIVGSAARAKDQFVRDTHGILAAIKSRIPFLRETLPIKIGAKGKPLTHQNLGPDFVSPVYISQISDDPVANEIIRLVKEAKLGIRPPGRTIDLTDDEGRKSKYEMTDEEYEQFSMAVGRAMYVGWTEAMMDPGWATLPIEQKAERIRDIATAKRREGYEAFRQMLPMPAPSTAPVRY